METFFTIIFIAFFIIAIALASIFNSLVSQRNAVKNAYAGIEAQLQKRFDLVPNLVATVQGYAAHERETLQKVMELRNAAMTSTSARGREDANEEMGAQLRQIIALAEAYPQLRAAENFLHLQGSLNEVEEQLAAARRTFNATVANYNNTVESFPSNLVANKFGFKTTDYFQVAAAAQRRVPDLKGAFDS